jgi:hypothetical protein
MKNIRSNVFETNSSSSHSLTIGNSDIVLDKILPDENGIIYLNGGEFGWEYDRHYSALTKANYCAIACHYNDYGNITHYNNSSFNEEMLIEVIKEQTGAKEVVLNIDNNSYIDHQSIESGILDEVFESKENLRNFIFNGDSYLIIDSDNSQY